MPVGRCGTNGRQVRRNTASSARTIIGPSSKKSGSPNARSTTTPSRQVGSRHRHLTQRRGGLRGFYSGSMNRGRHSRYFWNGAGKRILRTHLPKKFLKLLLIRKCQNGDCGGETR